MQEGGFIHRFVEREAGGPDFTLLLLHGTGGDERDLLPLGALLAPGAALLSPRGRVNEHGMARFFRRLREGVFDPEEVRRRADELANFVAEASVRHGFDPERVIAAGFSNGANIAAAVLLVRPGALTGAILFHAMPALEPAELPDLTGKRVFISGGRRDPIARPEQAERLAALLERAGAGVVRHWTEDGHTLSGDEIAAARAWLVGAHRGRAGA